MPGLFPPFLVFSSLLLSTIALYTFFMAVDLLYFKNLFILRIIDSQSFRNDRGTLSTFTQFPPRVTSGTITVPCHNQDTDTNCPLNETLWFCPSLSSLPQLLEGKGSVLLSLSFLPELPLPFLRAFPSWGRTAQFGFLCPLLPRCRDSPKCWCPYIAYWELIISFQHCGFPKSEVLPSFLGMEMWTGPAIEGCYAWRGSLPWILPPRTLLQAPRGLSNLPPWGQLFGA